MSIQKKKLLHSLNQEVNYLRIGKELKSLENQEKIKEIEHQFQKEICTAISNAFWNRKKHVVQLPYELGFNEKNIPVNT